MDSKEFEENIKFGKCPFCKQTLKHYDGAIGYEAVKCPDEAKCGFVADHTGYHIERT